MKVLDASAVLAYLHGESGADLVEEALLEGSCCGTATWSEVAQQVVASGRNWALASALLDSFGLIVEPVTREDAEWAAQRWRHWEGLSLGDRLCLAIGERLGVLVLTADRAWGDTDRVRQIR